MVFFSSETAFATNCGVAPASKGQLVSAAYVNSIKACIDTQYASCGVAEPAGLWTLSTGQTFTNEVSQGKIIRAEHIGIMQKAVKTLGVDMAGVPGAVVGAISFSPDCSGSASACAGGIVSAADATAIINAVNQFQCPLCGAMSLPVNDTTASFPTVGQGDVATGTCAVGGGSATATCGAGGGWGPATGTCCAAGQAWYSGACCNETLTCGFSGSCAAGSVGCGQSGQCACPSGQSCNGSTCVCPSPEVPYMGSCCTPSCGGGCGGGSDGCGGTCASSCPSGETCNNGISCVSIGKQYYVAATTCSAVTNTTYVFCYSPASYQIYNNESFSYCFSSAVSSPGSILSGAAGTNTMGIPVVNSGCGDSSQPYGEPGTSCTLEFPTCQDGYVTYTTDATASGNIPNVSAAGTQQSFSCPAGYISDTSGTTTSTFTCQTSGSWSSPALCMPPCTSYGSCPTSSSTSPTVCNAGTPNPCWYTPACPPLYEYSGGSCVEVAGVIIGGGTFDSGCQTSCSAWGSATCSGGTVSCPSGSTFTVTSGPTVGSCGGWLFYVTTTGNCVTN
ncbi:MAG: hypothetical protein KGJ95_06515 [Candidatus Omnitrophica bacterium]|nr:hypothetical protein [Candidatus Omnitrophota bacterium]